MPPDSQIASERLAVLSFAAPVLCAQQGQAYSTVLALEIHVQALFQPALEIQIKDLHGVVAAQITSVEFGHPVAWLPRGRIGWRWTQSEMRLPAGEYSVSASLSERHRGAPRAVCAAQAKLRVEAGAIGEAQAPAHLGLVDLPGGLVLAQQPWQRQYKDWFFRHFAHAAEVVASYMLGDAPELKGRILDIGCGDGITDLGIALRWQPEQLIGVDPFRGFERLPEILRESGMPTELPSCLSFEAHSANDLPYPDDHFDVVISWGSLEHIVGGYTQALREVRRVLRPGGRLFVHPGLYYSNFGHHLGEFSAEPHFHLRWSEPTLKSFVLERTPNYMDRSGEFASSAQYWQWYQELNRITVREFEQELRYLGFELHRAAMRVEDRVDYTPELQRFSLIDLLTTELYVSCINRKH